MRWTTAFLLLLLAAPVHAEVLFNREPVRIRSSMYCGWLMPHRITRLEIPRSSEPPPARSATPPPPEKPARHNKDEDGWWAVLMGAALLLALILGSRAPRA